MMKFRICLLGLTLAFAHPLPIRAYTCFPNLPTPQIAQTGILEQTVAGKQFTTFFLTVSNWPAFPAELFEVAPDLPPCGANTNASRTWVDIFGDGQRVYGYCGLGTPQDLTKIGFSIPSDESPPGSVFITLTDRRCGLVYQSNSISIAASSLACSDANVTEGNGGTSNAVFTVTLSPPANQTVEVEFATANGTATAGVDYVPNSGTLTFNPRETARLITVQVIGDTVEEASETFFVNLTGATNAIIGDSLGLGTIINDDGAVAVTADLSISMSVSSSSIATGQRLVYSVAVANAGLATATGVTVIDLLPPGTTLATVAASQGTVVAPPVGASGVISGTLGQLAVGGSATIVVELNILAVPGSTLANTATVSSATSDPKLGNNSATAITSIEGGGTVRLTWEQPAPTPTNPTPAPINLRIQPGSATSASLVAIDAMFPTADAPCTLIQVNIYKADVLPIATIPANLWKTVPPNQLDTTMAAAPGGSFYVITNVWQCGDTTVESGGSNQAGVPAGPTINRMKVGGKIKAMGEGFSDPAEIFLDGVGFRKQAGFRDSTLVVQKGPMTDGRFIGDVVTPGKTVVISVRNSNGGISSLAFTGQ
jgi:uncharacterized repeat protein (TIGR01451 family)